MIHTPTSLVDIEHAIMGMDAEVAFMAARYAPWRAGPMRVRLLVASSRVCQRTRSAFSPMCLDDCAEQLAKNSLVVTYEFRRSSVVGSTIAGSQRLDGAFLYVDADVSPPFYTEAEWRARIQEGIGSASRGKILRDYNTGGVHVVERAKLVEVAFVPLSASVDPAQPVVVVEPPT